MKRKGYTGSFKGTKRKFPLKKRKVFRKLLVGKSSIREIKCRDQIFSPGASIPGTVYTGVTYVEPTVAGLGLATGYTCLNCLEQGNGISQRIGNKVVLKSLRLKGQLSLDDSTTPPLGYTATYRVMVVYDKQTNGAAPVIGDIIANVGTAGAYVTAFNSGIRINNKNRFVVLKDKTFDLSDYSAVNQIDIDWFIKKNLETVYSATTNPPTITQISSGAILLLVFTDGLEGALPYLANFNCRLRYED